MAKKFSFVKKYSTSRLFNANIDGFNYFKLSDIFENEDKVYRVQGIYINEKSEFGASPVAAIEDRYVNLPSFMTSQCMEIRDDEAAVEAINNGTVGFKIVPYSKNGKQYYSIEWVEIEPDYDPDDID